MTLTVTGARSELGRLLVQQRLRASVHINVAGQQANTLLHDGHAWKDFERVALAGVRRALNADAKVLVHASFAFVLGDPPRDPLRSLAQVILDCEQRALSASIPACVVRLGYLYGASSRDLRAYRTAFRLGRPYWAGSAAALQYHVYETDAVAALIAAARKDNKGKILYATDGHPLPFMRFMDDFARKLGRRLPLHVPRIATPIIRAIVRKEHMQQCDLAMPERAPRPTVPNWKAKVTDYREGQDRVIASWNA
jgi:nucleoside-diphosphate-sugar epimerase